MPVMRTSCAEYYFFAHSNACMITHSRRVYSQDFSQVSGFPHMMKMYSLCRFVSHDTADECIKINRIN